jgi:hypothetical protein
MSSAVHNDQILALWSSTSGCTTTSSATMHVFSRRVTRGRIPTILIEAYIAAPEYGHGGAADWHSAGIGCSDRINFFVMMMRALSSEN